MATFSNGESGFSVRTKINDVLQHMDGTAGTLVVNEAGADVDFRVESDTNINALFVDGATGNVGLGTGVPNAPLTVNNQADNSTVAVLHAGGGTPNRGLKVSTFTNVNQNAGVLLDAQTTIGGATLAFANAGTERMRITELGNVGIGTSVPINFGAGYTTLQVSASTSGAIRISNTALTSLCDFFTDATSTVIRPGAGNALVLASNGTSRMWIDVSGNVGIGMTPNPWGVGRTLQLGAPNGSFVFGQNLQAIIGSNAYFDTTWRYAGTGVSTRYEQTSVGSHTWFTAPSGTAGNPISSTQVMTLDAGGNLGIGTVSPSARFHVLGGGGSINSVFDSSVGDTRIELRTAGTRAGYIYWDASENRFFADSSRFTTFYTGGSERMRLDSAGDLALGDTVTNGYRLTVGRPNPARGILANISNQSTSAQTGSQVVFTQNGIANWVIGQPAAVSAFSIWSGRNAGQDGVERMRIDDAGNLGLGTSSPSARLSVVGAAGTNLVSTLTSAVNTGSYIGFLDTTTTDRPLIGALGDNFVARTLGVERMRLDTAGNLGIGTTSPSGRLHVEAGSVTQNLIAPTGNGTFRMADSPGGANRKEFTIILDNANNRVDIQAVQQGIASRDITINGTGGNVGIGTTAPAARLNVNGGSIFVTASGTYSEPAAIAGVIAFDSANGDLNISARSSGGNTFTRFFTSNGGAGAERMRIENTGNLLVGTTATTGSASNTALSVSGGFRTASGGVATTNGIAATAFSITAGNRGRYDVVAMINNSGDAAQYASFATVLWDGSTGRIVANNATNLTITLSGSNVQVTQTSGTGQTVNWSFTRIAS
jgi:hypothetical protein